jgi:ATP-binding cassette subfamily F protein uup
VLEESLLEFPGALVLVTHDRYLLDRVSTQVLALDGNGGAEYFADYSQALQAQKGKPASSQPSTSSRQPAQKGKRLGYLEQRELDAMEATILAAETRLAAAQRAAEDPAVASDAAGLQQRFAELNAAQAEVDRLYARWAELEAKRA